MENQNVQNTETPELKPAWHRPTLSTIDIKRTMNASGSVSDGGTSQVA